jgi:hypothetical protein
MVKPTDSTFEAAMIAEQQRTGKGFLYLLPYAEK